MDEHKETDVMNSTSIQSEESIYGKLYNQWFKEVFRIYAIGFIIVVSVEIAMGFFMGFYQDFHRGLLYTLRRVLLPSVLDFILIYGNFNVFRNTKISEMLRNRITITALILIASVLSSVHNFFEIRFIFYVIPVVSSMAFANIKLMKYTCYYSIVFIWITLFLPLLWHDEIVLSDQILAASFISLMILVLMVVEKIILELYLEREKTLQDLFKENQILTDETERDALTGIYNRKGFIKHAAEHMHEHEHTHILFVCDVVNFKGINRQIGEQKADALLCHIANKVKERCDQTGDICGRYSGDQFVMILETMDTINEESLKKWAQNIVNTAEYTGFTLKFGICTNVKPDDSVSQCCDNAFLALSTIKEDYHKIVATYRPSMNLQLELQEELEKHMEESLQNQYFKIYYQPKHDAKTGKLVGAEALIRWKHPKLGLISPGKFIPLFEKNGFITELDLFVWDKVCSNLQRWEKEGYSIVPISSNLSRRDFFSDHLIDRLNATTDLYQVDKKNLHVEVTESMYMEDGQGTLRELVNEIHEDGYAIELDDFGSGYSSLGFIGEIPLDVIKLDMSFVRNLTSNMNIIRSVIYLAKLMHVKILAEGIETQEQLNTLKELGCDFIQGYYFSKPLTEQEFEEYMKENA